MKTKVQKHDTIVVGAGQAGLSVGYFLKQQRRDFILLDANKLYVVKGNGTDRGKI